MNKIKMRDEIIKTIAQQRGISEIELVFGLDRYCTDARREAILRIVKETNLSYEKIAEVFRISRQGIQWHLKSLGYYRKKTANIRHC
jgi:endonuclease III